MAKSVLIIMTGAGLDVGPIMALYSDVDGYAVPFESGILRSVLEAGYTSNVVPDPAAIIRVVCTDGLCVGSYEDSIISTSTTTSTSTSSTTSTSTSTTTSTSTSTTTSTSTSTTTSTSTSSTTSTTSTTTTAIPVVPCGTTINANGAQGIYLLNVNAGTSVGAIIVRFNPASVPDGIRAIFGTNVYNKLTAYTQGVHQSTNAGAFTYVGSIGADCGISGTTYPALTEYLYNGSAFVATGGTQSVTVAPGDVSLGTTDPGNCLMVIPKTTASPSIINFEMVGPCSGTIWQMSVACPVLLTGFSSSVMAPSSTAACALTETVTYYNASFLTSGTIELSDFVYSDAYGSTQLSAGFYRATGSITGANDWFQVDSNGVVIAIGSCSTPIGGTITFSTSRSGNDYTVNMALTSGTLYTTITVNTSFLMGYSVAGCSGSTLGGQAFPGLSISPSIPSDSASAGNHVGYGSRKITTLTMNGSSGTVTISSSPQSVTIDGYLYTIIGWGVCTNT